MEHTRTLSLHFQPLSTHTHTQMSPHTVRHKILQTPCKLQWHRGLVASLALGPFWLFVFLTCRSKRKRQRKREGEREKATLSNWNLCLDFAFASVTTFSCCSLLFVPFIKISSVRRSRNYCQTRYDCIVRKAFKKCFSFLPYCGHVFCLSHKICINDFKRGENKRKWSAKTWKFLRKFSLWAIWMAH